MQVARATEQAREPESYAEWHRSFVVRRLGIVLWVGIVAWASYLARDVAAYGWGSKPVAYRLVGELVLIATLLVHRAPFFQRHLHVAFIVPLCAMTFTSLLANVTGLAAMGPAGIDGAALQFQEGRFGVALIFVFAAAIVPALWSAHLAIQLATVAFFALNWDIFASLAAADRLLPGLQGLFWICFVCDLSIVLYSRLQRSEFEARRELEQVSRERKVHLDALERVGISATSTDPAQQARAALDEIIRALGVERAWLYLRDAAGRSRFQAGRDARGGDLAEPEDDGQERFELPLQMRDHRVGKILLERDAGVGGVSASDDPFLEALASHVAIALETVRTTEELRAARDRALDAGRAKDAFLQTMTHELRTPLNAMIGYSEMLQEDLGDAGDAEHAADAGKVRAAAAHLLDVIGDILELTNLETERGAVSASSFAVAELAAALEAEIRPLAEGNQNRLEFMVAEEVGSMRSDRARVETILRKLLENACKFTRQGKVACHVSRATVGGTESLRFRVSDTGIGMTEEQLGRCFEPFFQADPSATREYGGTGLGLTTALRLCETLGGELTAQSTPGQGSVFELILPVSLGTGH